MDAFGTLGCFELRDERADKTLVSTSEAAAGKWRVGHGGYRYNILQNRSSFQQPSF